MGSTIENGELEIDKWIREEEAPLELLGSPVKIFDLPNSRCILGTAVKGTNI